MVSGHSDERARAHVVSGRVCSNQGEDSDMAAAAVPTAINSRCGSADQVVSSGFPTYDGDTANFVDQLNIVAAAVPTAINIGYGSADQVGSLVVPTYGDTANFVDQLNNTASAVPTAINSSTNSSADQVGSLIQPVSSFSSIIQPVCSVSSITQPVCSFSSIIQPVCSFSSITQPVCNASVDINRSCGSAGQVVSSVFLTYVNGDTANSVDQSPSSDVATVPFWRLMDQYTGCVEPRFWSIFEVWEAFQSEHPASAARTEEPWLAPATARYQPSASARRGLQTRRLY